MLSRLSQRPRVVSQLAKSAAPPLLAYLSCWHSTIAHAKDYMVVGGGGLVGYQICRQILHKGNPQSILVTSLFEEESKQTCEKLKQEAQRIGAEHVEFIPRHGNIFLPAELATLPRRDLLSSKANRKRILEFIFGDFDNAYRDNLFSQMMKDYKPDVLIDCVNTATGISYQNVFNASEKVLDWLDGDTFNDEGVDDLEQMLIAQSVPQLIRHVRILERAARQAHTSMYLKVNTTGTGGMGLNIPYTHSEDKPSKVLLAKNEAAFGLSGLLFLLARTPIGLAVKELKPAAMIAYRAATIMKVNDKNGNDIIYEPKTVSLDDDAVEVLLHDKDKYNKLMELTIPLIDTGENGKFTAAEFEAISAFGQMEFLTPEEIAETAMLEIAGGNTGRDVIAALDSAVMGPTYKAGLIRSRALEDLRLLGESCELPSVALGQLGPPQLSKILYEAQLLKECFGSFEAINANSPESLGQKLEKHMTESKKSKVLEMATSIGIPVLSCDGKKLWRGVHINIPQPVGHEDRFVLDRTPECQKKMNVWASKGWLDLRPGNMLKWKQIMQEIQRQQDDSMTHGSSSFGTDTYFPGKAFNIGSIAAYILNNEMAGYRIKH